MDHNRKPHNYGRLEGANREAEGFNPVCGDHLTVYLQERDGVIADVRFQGEGCAISKASASRMTDSVNGKTTAEAEELFQSVHHMLTGDLDADVGSERLGKLAVFSGVREFPARIKCASLSWHALRNALKGERTAAKTE